MEDWEIELRAKLDKEIPNGAYQIGTPPVVAWTGKGGYIDFHIEMERVLRKLIKDGK